MSANLRSPMPAGAVNGSRPRITPIPQRPIALTLLDVFDRITIIHPKGSPNEERASRGLRSLSLERMPGLIEFIPEVPLAWPSGWANPIAGTAFMTHYSVLKQAMDRRWRSVLIWDDCADFAQELASCQSEVIHSLSATAWDVLFLGFTVANRPSNMRYAAHQPQAGLPALWRVPYNAVNGVTAYAVSQSFLPDLVGAMEQVLVNPTRLASPLAPTASVIEPNAISLVLSKVLRVCSEARAYVPIKMFSPEETDAAPPQQAKTKVIEFSCEGVPERR